MALAGKQRALGKFGEEYAARYLAAKGFSILARNWRSKAGEVDIVARLGELAVICEVKTRRSNGHGDASEAIDATRLERLLGAAGIWAAEHPGLAVRVDAICLEVVDEEVLLRHLEGISL